MAALRKETLYFIAGLAVAAASAGGFGLLAWRGAHGPSSTVARVQLADAPFTPTAADAAVVKTENWATPTAQSRGREWVYDAFTPPEIFYNARSKHFTVKPQLEVAEEAAVEEPFGVELVSVRPEPFRLQLFGFVGSEGDWRGTFENIATGQVFLAGAGRRVPELALSIKRLGVESVDVKIPDSMTTHQRVAIAIIHDDKSGRDVTITNRERVFTGGVSAFIAETGQSATREVRPGDRFQIGQATYRVDRVQLAPPAVDLTKESPTLAQPDTRTLLQRESDDTPSTDTPAPTS
jgi:hypothetical protein